jgi:hypothetical protein
VCPACACVGGGKLVSAGWLALVCELASVNDPSGATLDNEIRIPSLHAT